MTKVFTAVLAAGLLTAGATLAAEPDDLVLPEGFHATVFYDGSGPAEKGRRARHDASPVTFTDEEGPWKSQNLCG